MSTFHLFPSGCYENVALLKKFSSVKGADWNIKDNSGTTPLEYAVKRGSRWMAAGLQFLIGSKPKVSVVLYYTAV